MYLKKLNKKIFKKYMKLETTSKQKCHHIFTFSIGLKSNQDDIQQDLIGLSQRQSLSS